MESSTECLSAEEREEAATLPSSIPLSVPSSSLPPQRGEGPCDNLDDDDGFNEEADAHESSHGKARPPVGVISVDRSGRGAEAPLDDEAGGAVHVRQLPQSAGMVPLGMMAAAEKEGTSSKARAAESFGAAVNVCAGESRRLSRKMGPGRLSFRSDVLYGRTEEMTKLTDAYRRFEGGLSRPVVGGNGEYVSSSSTQGMDIMNRGNGGASEVQGADADADSNGNGERLCTSQGTDHISSSSIHSHEANGEMRQSQPVRVGRRQPKEVVLLRGLSGVGKSALAEQLRHIHHRAEDHRNREDDVPNTGAAGSSTSTPTRPTSPIFLRGKYDKLRRHQPYSAYAAAFWDLCDLVLREDEEARARAAAAADSSGESASGDSSLRSAVRDAVLDAVGGSWKVLGFVFENLKQIMETRAEDEGNETVVSHSTRTSGGSGTVDVDMTREDFHYIFKMFLRAVCKALGRDRPLILFLDDLQWADVPSFQLTDTLLSDANCDNGVFFVFAYRDNEVDDDHPLRSHIETWQGKSDGGTDSGPSSAALNLTDIEVGDLGLDAVVDLLSDSLGASHERVRPLAETVINRTKGNAFFSTQYLRMLEEEGLLTCIGARGDSDAHRWSWDDDAIAARTDLAGQDVMELIVYRIQRLPPEAQDALCLAACFGSRFDAAMLELLAADDGEGGEDNGGCNNGGPAAGDRDCNRDGDATGAAEAAADDRPRDVAALMLSKSSLRSSLDTLLRDGLIMPQPGGGVDCDAAHRFSHDRIQQVAYSLVPPDDADLWHMRIGERLWESVPKKQLQKRLFVVVDQLNRGAELVDEPRRRVAVAQLNFAAGRKAMSSSAFISAASYFRAGVDLLERNEDRWATDYALCLVLYEMYAEACSCNGNFDQMESLHGEIFEHGRSLEDKLKAYVTLVDSLAARDRLEEAMVTGFDILGDLGEPIPQSVSKRLVITQLLKTKLSLRGKNVEALGPMTDATKKGAMLILGTICLYAYLAKMEFIPILAFRMIQLTMKYGIHDKSPGAFAIYGAIQCGAMRNYKQGYDYGQLSLRLLKKSGKTASFPQIHIALSVLNHWAEPLRSSLPTLLNAYSVGMRLGQTQNATIIAHLYCRHCYFSGCPLPGLETEMRSFYDVMSSHGQQVNMDLHEPLWQSAQNLMGHSADPLVLTGEVMTQEQNIRHARENGDRLEASNIYFWRLILAGLFGEHELAVEMAEKSRFITIKVLAGYANTRHAFFQGLSAIAMARRAQFSRRKSQWKKLAKSNMAKLRKYDRLKSGNREHMILLLKAEYAAMKGTQDKAMQSYEAAIRSAKENEFLQDEGLSCEKAAVFLLEWERVDEAKVYMDRAISCYSRWGARAKVDQLKLLYPSLLTTSAGQAIS